MIFEELVKEPFSSLSDLNAAFNAKKITVHNFTESLLSHIQQQDVNTQSFLSFNTSEALKQAKVCDEKLAQGHILGPLEGLPIAIKDNIHIKNQKSTCASKMLEDFYAPFDATVIEKLKQAGMIFVGKTNMDEFAMGSTTATSAFQSTKNPWDLACTPGGSSGGSAAAVAADLVPVALGSDTGGSIRQPAAFCGISGLKPTYGTVSRYGLVAFASSLDQIGPMARRCEDLKRIYQVISGPDPKDSTSTTTQAKEYGDDLSNKTFVVPKNFIESLDASIQKSFEHSLSELKELGVNIEYKSFSSFDAAVATYYILAGAEASSNLARFDGVRYTKRSTTNTLSDMIMQTRGEFFGDEVKRRILLGTHVLSSGYYDAYYNTALRARQFIQDELNGFLGQADAILCPTTPSTAFSLEQSKQDPLSLYLCDIATIPANISGFPALSIPSGFIENKPVGLQLIGKAFDDYKLLQFGSVFQKHLPYHLAVAQHKELS